MTTSANKNTAEKKPFPAYLIALIAMAAFALVAFVSSLIAGATVELEGEWSGFEKLLYALGEKMPKPPIFGTWHIVSLVLAIALAAFLVAKFKDCSDVTLRRIFLVMWLIMLFFEVYKQFHFAFRVEDYVTWQYIHWEYDWNVFPFQFCSTPLYLLPILVFAKEGKFRNAISAYMVTFSLLAGLIVMIYPGDVFSSTTSINIQTMVHHGFQLAIGIFLAAHNRHKLNKRFFAWSVAVFAALSAVALILNVVMHYAKPGVGFNMFYISPFQPCTLPVLSAIYPLVPYPVYLLIYVLGFALVSAIIYAIEKCTVYVCSRIKKNGKN